MRLGTAVEDALRRDLTLNALFYRLGDASSPRPTEQPALEDLTGHGLADLVPLGSRLICVWSRAALWCFRSWLLPLHLVVQ